MTVYVSICVNPSCYSTSHCSWLGSSRPDRLRDIADRFNVDHDAVLDNVLYARAYTSTNTLTNFDTFVMCKDKAGFTEMTSSGNIFGVKVGVLTQLSGEHQMELLDFVAAKFHEEGGVFKLLVSRRINSLFKSRDFWTPTFLCPFLLYPVTRSLTPSWLCSE